MINVFSCQKVRHFVPSDRSLWHGVLGSDVRHSNVHSAGVQCLQCWVVLFCSLGRETAAASATAWERGICEGCRGASGCSQPCLMVTPSGNMGALGTLWMYLRWFRYGDGVCSPWGSSGSGRKELVEKPFFLRGIWGEIPSLSSWKTSREISWSENYGHLRCTLVVFAIPPSLSPFSLVFYFITIQSQNLWEKIFAAPQNSWPETVPY